ncbi:hypothetical protein B0J11DRAFT_530370 [Dendryphion nanum]|uniref:Uncharacterized protein n=1 Tax=Dendryphion nanum TaxID=256645 RepID=A0A9P9DRI2_9PLEO|nr:hypothetical protein B0J11DRAFT_530370 [Dendryphion nanum]
MHLHQREFVNARSQFNPFPPFKLHSELFIFIIVHHFNHEFSSCPLHQPRSNNFRHPATTSAFRLTSRVRSQNAFQAINYLPPIPHGIMFGHIKLPKVSRPDPTDPTINFPEIAFLPRVLPPAEYRMHKIHPTPWIIIEHMLFISLLSRHIHQPFAPPFLVHRSWVVKVSLISDLQNLHIGKYRNCLPSKMRSSTVPPYRRLSIVEESAHAIQFLAKEIRLRSCESAILRFEC